MWRPRAIYVKAAKDALEHYVLDERKPPDSGREGWGIKLGRQPDGLQRKVK